jgi:hypothetical protein
MLSSTNTVTDVKAKLENNYAYFGYTTDVLFTAGITSVASDVELIYFYPRIGSAEYDRIKAKNKVSLTETETYLYWAEVFTICHFFLRARTAKTGQLQNSANEKLSVEGYSYQTSASTGSSPGDIAQKFYWDRMFAYWKLAGYDIMSLQRTCTIFGDSELSEDTVNIIP